MKVEMCLAERAISDFSAVFKCGYSLSPFASPGVSQTDELHML